MVSPGRALCPQSSAWPSQSQLNRPRGRPRPRACNLLPAGNFAGKWSFSNALLAMIFSEEEKFPQWNHWHPQESSLYPGSRSAGSGHCHKKSHFQAAKLAKTFGMKKGPRLVPRVCCFRGIVYLSEGLWPNKLLHSSHHCGSMRIGQVQQSLKLNIFICFLLYKREK